MPQMNPMNWFLLFIFFSMSFLCMGIKINAFMYNPLQETLSKDSSAAFFMLKI